VPVVYNSFDKDTSLASLDCLRPLGLMVSFGNASGKVETFDIGILSQKGSLYLTRPTLATYTATRADLEATAAEVFEVLRNGTVKIEIRHRYPLAQGLRIDFALKVPIPYCLPSCARSRVAVRPLRRLA
jgi:NADPH:quinone reductase